MAKQKIDNLKGLYTNAENVSLEYAVKSENIRYKTGYIYTEGLVIDSTKQFVETGYTLEGFTEVILNDDKNAIIYNSTSEEGFLYVLYKLEGSQIVYQFILEIDGVAQPLQNSGSLLLEFPFTEDSYKKTIVTNTEGKIKIYTPYHSYLIQIIRRSIYGVTTSEPDPISKNYYIEDLIKNKNTTPDFTLIASEVSTVPVSSFPAHLVKVSGPYNPTSDQTFYYFNLILDDPIKTCIGGFELRITAGGSDITDYYAFYQVSDGTKVDLSSIMGATITIDNGFTSAILYWLSDSDKIWYANDSVEVLSDYNSVVFSIINANYNKSIISNQDADKFLISEKTYFRFILTGVANGEEYIIDQTTMSETLSSFFIKLQININFGSLNLIKTNFKSLEMIKIYYKASVKVETVAGPYSDIGQDYEEIFVYSFLEKNVGKDLMNIYINNQSPTGVYLSQTMGFTFSETNPNRNIKQDGLTSYKLINGVGYAVKNNILYYSAIGGGTIQVNSFFIQNEIIFDEIVELKGIIKIGNGLGIITEKELILVDIQNAEGDLLFTLKDRLALLIESIDDVVEVGTEIFAITQRGLLSTDGYKEEVISEPINDKIIGNTEDKRIIYDKFSNLLYFLVGNVISDRKLYFYDILSKAWSEYVLYKETMSYEEMIVDFNFIINKTGELVAKKLISVIVDGAIPTLTFDITSYGKGNIPGLIQLPNTNSGDLTLYKTINFIDLDIENRDTSVPIVNPKISIGLVTRDIISRRTYMKQSERIPCEKFQLQLEGNFKLNSGEIDLDTTLGLDK